VILHPSWTSDHKLRAQQFFLSEPAGELLIETLKMNRPRFAAGKTLEDRAMQGTAAAAWEDCIDMIAAIINADPNPRSDELTQIDTSQLRSIEVPP
jgi:hypothetical protein